MKQIRKIQNKKGIQMRKNGGIKEINMIEE